ncbi:polysaccharide deacetylase family protein [Candidatus Peregrinibacteria bacterium]|nr:polysaccharide deacetylase family protein [Candidatus Peregrinibacteria bacterium]
MKPKKIIRSIFDGRMPYFIPYWITQRILRRSYFNKNIKKIIFSITCDFEQDYGSMGTFSKGQKPDLEIFLKSFEKILNLFNAKATFFIQADLVKEFQKELKGLEKKKHELGVHGLHHELWGEAWFCDEEQLSKEEKGKAIKKSLEIFKKHELKRPISFRAPNMVIDKETYQILGENDFIIDSSPSSFLGVKPLPKIFKNTKIIPVTSDPKPHFRLKKGIIPFADFQVLNLHNILRMPDDYLVKYVKRVISYQSSYNVFPHVVFLTHPWEFKKATRSEKCFEYCSETNYERLGEKLKVLTKKFDISFLNMMDLAKSIEK